MPKNDIKFAKFAKFAKTKRFLDDLAENAGNSLSDSQAEREREKLGP